MQRIKECWYCKKPVRLGARLYLKLRAEIAMENGRNIQTSGYQKEAYTCTKCAREFFGIKVLEISNVSYELDDLVKKFMPKQTKKFNPSRR